MLFSFFLLFSVTIPSLAGGGSGVVDGVGTGAAIYPSYSGLAVATNGNIYLLDQSAYKVRLITTTGTVTTFAGSGVAGFADGPGVFSSLYPTTGAGLAADSLGNLYVGDFVNFRIRKIVPLTGGTGSSSSSVTGLGDSAFPDGSRVPLAGNMSTLAGSGTQAFVDGLGTAASFLNPCAIAVRLFVTFISRW